MDWKELIQLKVRVIYKQWTKYSTIKFKGHKIIYSLVNFNDNNIEFWPLF